MKSLLLVFRICMTTSLVMVWVLVTHAIEAEYTVPELLRLNRNYWERIHTLDIEYVKDIYLDGRHAVSLPTARWTLAVGKERLKTYGWYVLSDNMGKKRIAGVPEIETYPIDFFRESGKYLFVRGQFSGTEVPASLVEADTLQLFSGCVDDTVFDSGTSENFYLHCPGNTWLPMRSGFLMRFSQTLNPFDETLASFAEKNRTSPPVSFINARQERIWDFKIFPKIHREGETDDSRYIEVWLNESRGFLLDKLSYCCVQTWKGSTKKKLIVDNAFIVSDYRQSASGISFPSEVRVLRHAMDETPESGIQQKITLKTIRLNEGVSADAFYFKIPCYTRITHFPPIRKNGKLFFVISIWGDDDKPMFTFSEPRQYDAYEKEQYEKYGTDVFPVTQTYPSLFRVILMGLGLVLIIIALYMKIRKGS